MMVTTTVTRLSQDHMAAFNSHDLEKILSFYTSDCIIENIGLGKFSRGLQEVRKYYSDLFKAFPDIKIDFKTDIRLGDWSATEWVMTGTNTGIFPSVGNLPEIPATNKKIAYKGATINQLRSEKISRETDYWNMAALMQQLGLMQAMPAK
jgi:steroid delta-isomerase-like uncharacterized protein